MARKLKPLFCAVIFGGLLTSNAAAYVPPDGNPPASTAPLPKRIIVKYKPTAGNAALDRYEKTKTFKSSLNADTLDSLHAKHKIKNGRRLFQSLDGQLKKGKTEKQLFSEIKQKFSKRSRRIPPNAKAPELGNIFILELEDATDPAAAAKDFSSDPNVEYAEPDQVATVQIVPNDPYYHSSNSWGHGYDDMWGLKKIQAAQAWDQATGEGIVVAVVDTGLDYNHPDIAANVWTNPGEIPNNNIDDDGNGYIDDVRGWDFVTLDGTPPDNNPIDDNGHGTHVAGTIAATGNNNVGVLGLAWRSKVMALKGLAASGGGQESNLAECLYYAVVNGADVINNSWGGPGSSQLITDAVNHAHSVGAVVVAAAGNSNANAATFMPANIPTAITVAAFDNSDNKASFSNFGINIDVAAPGVNILSLRAAGMNLGPIVGNNYMRLQGTSMAAPHVSGLAALTLSKQPGFTNEQVRQVLRTTADDVAAPGFDIQSGYGRINANRAMTVGAISEARILSPLAGEIISGPVSITGSAKGPSFSYYTLEYGTGETPGTWTTLQISSHMVNASVLGVFDPSRLPDGKYAIRLQVFQTSGSLTQDRTLVVINNVEFTDPSPVTRPSEARAYKTGRIIPIMGRATGADFQRFRLEWAKGINSSPQWSSQGVTLTNGGLQPVQAGQLAELDTSLLNQSDADYLLLRLTVETSNFISEERTLIYLEPDFLGMEWPQFMENGGSHATALPEKNNVFQSDISAIDSFAHRFSWNGIKKVRNAGNLSPISQYAAADLENDGAIELVAGGYNSIDIVRSNGALEMLTPGNGDHILSFSNIHAEDLDADGRKEIIAVDYHQASSESHLFAYKSDGSLYSSNFPITTHKSRSSSWTNDVIIAGFSSAHEGKEILTVNGDSPNAIVPNYSLKLYSGAGVLIWDNSSARVTNAICLQAAAGDIDQDGSLEIITVHQRVDQPILQIVVFDSNGTILSGWPISVPSELSYGSFVSLALGDLDKNGDPEIVLSFPGMLYVFKKDGSLFSSNWPRPTPGPGFSEGLALGDINGDGFPEIVTVQGELKTNPLLITDNQSAPARITAQKISTQYIPNGGIKTRIEFSPETQLNSFSPVYYEEKLLIFDLQGQLLKSWKLSGKPGYDGNGARPYIGDFNEDGKVDIAVTYSLGFFFYDPNGFGFANFRTALALYSLNAPYNQNNIPWPTRFHDPQNTSVLPPLPDTTPPGVALTAPPNGATLSGLVTVTATASDNKSLSHVDFRVDGTVRGQMTLPPSGNQDAYVFSWDTRAETNGNHSLTAVAYDAAGNEGTSPTVTIKTNNPKMSVALDYGSSPPIWYYGTRHTISWTPEAAPTDAWVGTVRLYRDNKAVFVRDLVPAFSYNPAPGQVKWTVPSDIPADDDYQVQVMLNTGPQGGESNIATGWSSTFAISPDQTAPTLSITKPFNNATVSRSVQVSVNVTDNAGVAKVEYYVDNSIKYVTDVAPYSWLWDTRKVSNGYRKLMAKAYDGAGNMASKIITVRVSNSLYGSPATAMLGPSGGQVGDLMDTGVAVKVPAGVLAGMRTLTIEPGSASGAQVAAGHRQSLDMRTPVVNVSLAGSQEPKFSRPVEVSLSYNGESTQDDSHLTLAWWNTEKNKWQPLPPEDVTVDEENMVVTGRVDHFSAFAVVEALGVTGLQFGEVFVYPNPAESPENPTFHIEAGEADSINIHIYDLSGKSMQELSVSGSPRPGINGRLGHEIVWDASGAASGVYVAHVQASKDGRSIKTLLKFAVVR